MAIMAAINRLVQSADVPDYAKLPACNFLAKEATQAANLTDTEKVILLERAQNCRNL